MLMDEMGPIGVFDSGYGGLTVLKELTTRLPQYDYIYLGDNARSPYGNRSFDLVYEFTLQAVKELFDRGCHLVILACNTASAKALRTIQQHDLPLIAPEKRVLGVIRPSTELIGQLSLTRHIGILATEGTVRSESYRIELAKFAPDCCVVQRACPMWVPIIENNYQNSDAGRLFIFEDVEAILKDDPQIDTLVLACTHYPLVADYIRTFLSDNIKLITQGALVAARLEDYLLRHPELDSRCSKNGTIRFLTSENRDVFDEQAKQFLALDVRSEHIHF